jgi:hypothetical protein
MWTGGLANYVQGTIWDGVEIENCDIYEVSQWSYNYGEMIGALAWMHKAVRTPLPRPRSLLITDSLVDG